jgi:hypothetical protein
MEGEVVGARRRYKCHSEAIKRRRQRMRCTKVDIFGWAALQTVAKLQRETTFQDPVAIRRKPSKKTLECDKLLETLGGGAVV